MKEYRGILTNQSINQSINQLVNPNKTKKDKTKNYHKTKQKKGTCKLTKICSRSHNSKEGESYVIRRAQIVRAAHSISQGQVTNKSHVH